MLDTVCPKRTQARQWIGFGDIYQRRVTRDDVDT
jgi:hypothetical protein